MSLTSTLHIRGHPLQRAMPAQVAWFAAGAGIAFLVPFVFSSLLDLHHDLYYLVYFVAAGTFLGIYAQATQLDLAAMFRRNWRLSLVLGVVASAFLVFRILSAEDSTPHPTGLYFAFEIGWRGLVYGVVDALLLTAFPVAVVYAVFQGRLDSVARKAGFAVLTLGLVWIITATYHLGYEQFREDGVAGPETGNTIISLPAVLSANPLGAVVAHASMHVTAAIHAYETDLYLPPQTFVEGKARGQPEEAARAFYAWYLDYAAGPEGRNPLVDGAYRDSVYLSPAFIERLDRELSGPIVADPILCAQDVPRTMAVIDFERKGNTATVTMQSDLTGAQPVLVELERDKGAWTITDVLCR